MFLEKKKKTLEEIEEEVEKEYEREFYLRAAKIKERYYNLEKEEMYGYEDSYEDSNEINQYNLTPREQKIIDDMKNS